MRIDSVIAEYIASNVSGLTEWDASAGTGNVRVGLRDHTLSSAQVVVRYAGSSQPNALVQSGVRNCSVIIAVYGDDETAFNYAESIHELFQLTASWSGTGYRVIRARCTDGHPVDRSLLMGDTSRWDVPIDVVFHTT